MPKYRGVVIDYQPYSKPTAKRYDALGTSNVRILGHNTFRRMKVRSIIPLTVGDMIEFDDIDGMGHNVVKMDKRRSRTLLYK